MKLIGIIGGMSWESSAIFYRLINQLTNATLGGHNNARSLMYSVNFDAIESLQSGADWERLGAEMAAAALRLERGGADFIVVCSNTMHKVSACIEAAVSIPLMHIVDSTADRIVSTGMANVGLLGTRFTMEDGFYQERMRSRNINILTPTPGERKMVHRIIYEELCLGRIREESKAVYLAVIDNLVRSGAEAVILGCTEIRMLLTENDSALPFFDSTLIHAQEAVRYALEGL